MKVTRNIAIDAIGNLNCRLDDILKCLDTDELVDIALYLMRVYGDDAELDTDELEQMKDYANIHGIEG